MYLEVYSASKPASSMASSSAARLTSCGSKATFASAASSETSAEATPGRAPSTPLMFRTQPWQLMPPILMTVFSMLLPVHKGLAAQHVGHGSSRNWTAEDIALRHVTAHFTQQRQLLGFFHPFGQYRHAQAAPHADDGRGNGPVIGIALQVIDERAIDLQLADWKALQIGQR